MMPMMIIKPLNFFRIAVFKMMILKRFGFSNCVDWNLKEMGLTKVFVLRLISYTLIHLPKCSSVDEHESVKAHSAISSAD